VLGLRAVAQQDAEKIRDLARTAEWARRAGLGAGEPEFEGYAAAE
jgi:hypothetical protein